MNLKLLAAATAFVSLAGPAEAAVIVLPTLTTRDYVLQGGPKLANPPGNPATLISVTVTPTVSGQLKLGPINNPIFGTTVLGPVTAGQTSVFTPNIQLYGAGGQFGFWFSHLSVESAPGINELTTFSNVTVDLGTAFAPVPEPSTWTAMIAGFGLLGCASRVRYRRSVRA